MKPTKDIEVLMNEMVFFGKEMLKNDGEFHPYGGFINFKNEIIHVAAESLESDHPSSRELLEILYSSFHEKIKNRECKATAVVLDVIVKIPVIGSTSDAIQVNLDHESGYSAEVFFPYKINKKKEVSYGNPFAQDGAHTLFKKVNAQANQ